MNTTPNLFSLKNLSRDFPASIVVFLVALPLCLGIALASNAPLMSGVIAGIVGGIIVGSLSGSHVSVAGPAAGLTAVVASQIDVLGSFQAFLLATVIAGLFQIGLGLARAGFIASFFPSSVIKGLLAAIGVILILKQIPHAVGHDPDPIGEMQFQQTDNANTFSELLRAAFDIQPGAALIGGISLLILVGWDRVSFLKRLRIPVPLVVVVLAVLVNLAFSSSQSPWTVGPGHLVQVPVANGLDSAGELLTFPDWSQLTNTNVYVAAFTIAVVASLETLLNLQAADNVDPQQRHSPPSRELLAQGVGNMTAGLIGGLPVTSVIVRSSVNATSGSKTKMSTIIHGTMLAVFVLAAPHVLNLIPLAALAAILIVTGFKLASPKLIWRMWSEGWAQFAPFAVTVLAIVVTDLLTGIVIGLCISVGFILHGNLRRPVKRIIEKHVTGDVLRIELGNLVSFLNRAALEQALHSLEKGRHVLIDARHSDYIDPDILDLVHDFKDKVAPAHGVTVSLLGFKERYTGLEDDVQFVDYSTRELQSSLTPGDVLTLLKEGNRRFRRGERLTRDLRRQVLDTANGQAPFAVVLSCIDSRTPSELIFDLGIGDVFSVRIAGNVAVDKVLGSIEFGCVKAGAKLIVVLGHTHCGAVTEAVNTFGTDGGDQSTGCRHVQGLIEEIQKSIDPDSEIPPGKDSPSRAAYIDSVALHNVRRAMQAIRPESPALDRLIREGKVAIVGGLYDVASGEVTFCEADGIGEDELTQLDDTRVPLISDATELAPLKPTRDAAAGE